MGLPFISYTQRRVLALQATGRDGGGTVHTSHARATRTALATRLTTYTVHTVATRLALAVRGQCVRNVRGSVRATHTRATHTARRARSETHTVQLQAARLAARAAGDRRVRYHTVHVQKPKQLPIHTTIVHRHTSVERN